MPTQSETCRWGEARYYTLDHYLKETFGRRLYKLALNGGMTCPNRDGTLGTRGCIFCSAGGSGEYAAGNPIHSGEPDSSSVTRQIETAKALIAHKVPPSLLPSYIAYFQSYTNTYPPAGYEPVKWLRKLFLPAILHPDVAVLSIATRPDCLSEDICDLLAELNQIKPVWIELGLQTSHEQTARRIRRGYENTSFEQAMDRLSSRSLETIIHLILGLPGETLSDMIASVRYINRFHPQGVKFHLLHVLRNTDLALEWEQKRLHILSEEEYIDCLLACLSELSPDTVVHRVTGDGPRSLLLAPDWSRSKKSVLNHIRHEMKIRDVWQGKDYRKEDGHAE